MMKFLGGPAAGKFLRLRRAPYFLRVVIDPEGGIDALDQLNDQARNEEVIYVYRLAGKVTRGIACSRGCVGSGCHVFLSAEYEWYGGRNAGPVPADSVLRDNAAWAQWAEREYHRQRHLIDVDSPAAGVAESGFAKNA